MKSTKKDIYLIQTILFSFVCAGLVFGYSIYRSKGFFTITGDFNDQQLPFATAVWNMLHSDDPGEWIWNMDLGSSFITAFSFYNLGSPFFWLSLLFPRGSFPYLAGFLYILKYVTAAVTAYLYLRLFLDNRKWGVIGALLYAFSGYQTTNLLFYHFHDVVAVFPLLLWGLEMSMRDKKYRPAFMLAVFINCLMNYYFFVGQVVFLVIYYLARYRKLSKRQFVSGILSTALCGLLGIGMAAVLFIPNVIYLLGNSRGQSTLYLKDLTYSTTYFLHIIKGILLPGDCMDSHSTVIQRLWTSTSAYLPFFGISLAIAYVKSKQKSWISVLLRILGILSLFPLLGSIFLLFSESNQRWWYMLVLVLSLATTKVLDHIEDYPATKSSGLYVAIVSILYFSIRFVKWDADGGSIVYNAERFTMFYLIALAGPLLFCVLKRVNRNSYKVLLTLTMCACILTTELTLHYYRISFTDLKSYKENFEAGLQLKTIDEQYRYKSVGNISMLTGDASGIGIFCTTVENSSRKFDTLFEHYSGNSTQNRYDIGQPELLGGKYVISKDIGDNKVLYKVSAGNTTYYISEKNACPIGFAVDYVITEEELRALPKEQRALALMQAAIVGEEDFYKLNGAAARGDVNSLDHDEANLDTLIANTVANKVSDFHRDSHGFTCTADYDRSRLLYFTVPWSSGWKVTVDGTETEIIDSGGMMALSVPEGEHQIVFTYHTPGFRAGILVSIISSCVFFGFALITKKKIAAE